MRTLRKVPLTASIALLVACSGESPDFAKSEDTVEQDSGSKADASVTPARSDDGSGEIDDDAGNDDADDAESAERDDEDDEAVACSGSETRTCSEAGLLGNCALGTQSCENGSFGECDIQPAAEDTCDPGDDANCDGVVNDGCSCVEGVTRPCSADGMMGNCAAGEQVCLADGSWSECDVEPAEADDCTVPGDDADCDGSPNTGCECTDDETQPCGPSEAVGICMPGTSTCVDGSFETCQGAVEAIIRDCSSTEDNDCDGTPDNMDPACECEPGDTQTCDAHPGLDGNGQCQAGTATCAASVDGSSSSWGDCLGSVGPKAADSCTVVGDDGNCNGDPNDSCDCTSDSDCDDGVSCTTNTCENLTCENAVSSGFCLIDGECIAHNTQEPGDPCRFCDATLNPTGWTNASPGSSCDDGVFCNGADTCNGGTCTSEFPALDRCRGSGPCDANSCDEAAGSCYKAQGESCGNTSKEYRCASGGNPCGRAVESRELQRVCLGGTSACTGAPEPITNWGTATTCAHGQLCTADATGNNSCADDAECADTYCDPTNNLCWTAFDSADEYSQSGAEIHCDGLDFAHTTSWRLPTNDDARQVRRGCDDLCTVGEGPGTAGCYWPEEMGTCALNLWLDNQNSGYWIPSQGGIGFTAFGDYKVRCVTTWN